MAQTDETEAMYHIASMIGREDLDDSSLSSELRNLSAVLELGLALLSRDLAELREDLRGLHDSLQSLAETR